MKVFFGTIAAILGFCVLYVALAAFGAGFKLFTLPLLNFTKKVDLNAGVINKTYNTDYCLANYEWFKDTYQDIQQTQTKVANVQAQLDEFKTDAGDRSTWTFEDKTQYNKLTSSLTGTKNYLADIIGQYNSKTGQLNRVACKELPLFVPVQ